ncbi:C1q-related factor-like [Anneissia japonica]|uniref:C1q-related factor-like n=1 Tax=Anneissia japonica TaxID=1529436 RepID=UPI0014257C4B|nr:C1q-related factor-like [Anneissia japonica]
MSNWLIKAVLLVVLVFVCCEARTKKYKRTVAFSVLKTARTEYLTSNITSYENVVTNVGEDFDEATGMFTCVIPGLYFFKFHFPQTATNLQNTTVTLYKNSLSLPETYITSAYEKEGRVDYGGGSALVELAAGENVYLYLEGQLYLQTNKPLVFNGLLIYRDI